MTKKIFLDFESFSRVDLPEVGPWVYAWHDSTALLCLSWRTADESGFWVSEDIPAEPQQQVLARRAKSPGSIARLFELIEDRANIVEAHNAMMERCMWHVHGELLRGWPQIEDQQWRCSAAKAAACALPRDLAGAGNALHLSIVKDESNGSKMMKKLSKPDKKGNLPVGTDDDWEILYQYCENDTAAEMCLSDALPDLTPRELVIWRADQAANWRGFPIDRPGAARAVEVAAQWTDALNAELREITGGQVERATQRARLKTWLATQNVHFTDTTANTLDLWLQYRREDHEAGKTRPDLDKAVRAITILRSIGRSSTAKYQTLLDSSNDDRARDCLMYFGATTGRWSAKRFQPQNLARGTMKTMEQAWELVMKDKPISEIIEDIQLYFGDVMETLSSLLRGVILASPGQWIHSGDYAQIETRVNFWISDEHEALNVFRDPTKDIYCETATTIYGRVITKLDEMARQLGKQATLGLGFGMSYRKFLITCRGYKMKFTAADVKAIVPLDKIREISEFIQNRDWDKCADSGFTIADLPELVLMKFVTDRYRERFRNTVCALWTKVENAAKAAIANPGKSYLAGKCYWQTETIAGRLFLTVILPSRRKLYYPDVELVPDNRNTGRTQICFMGVDAKTHQWIPEYTYGAKLVENIVQAIARDFMAEAMVRIERDPDFELLLTVHDEVLAQARKKDTARFLEIVSRPPKWAEDFPLKAEGWAGLRYKK